jgi:uncharacterized membrane protein
MAEASHVHDPVGVLAVLLCTLALILYAAARPPLGRFFKIVPPLVLCYFVPAGLVAAGVLPRTSDLYEWVKQWVLPGSLVLLTVSLDLKAILRLGPKAVVVFLAGSVGVVVGGPIALLIWHRHLPVDAWQAMSYLAGSWIGGSANGVAVARSFRTPDAAIAPLIVVDAALAYIWMGLLLFLAARRTRVDRWLRADPGAVKRLEVELAGRTSPSRRDPTAADWLGLMGVAFGGAWVGAVGADRLACLPWLAGVNSFISPFAWTVILATAIGTLLSFTPIQSLEAAGASRTGGIMVYLLVASIGAGADFAGLFKGETIYYLALGVTWILIHGLVIFATARVTRSPFFFVAVGSQANIGGVASAPLVAAAFNTSLAPVGVLLAIAGYALGTYGGQLCAMICRAVAGSG